MPPVTFAAACPFLLAAVCLAESDAFVAAGLIAGAGGGGGGGGGGDGGENLPIIQTLL